MKHRKSLKKCICWLLALCCCLVCAGCASGGTGYGVKAVMTLVDQEYSIAFRNDDPTAYYVIGAIQALDEEGKLSELCSKWFGQRIISFPRTNIRLDELPPTDYRDFIIGLDINSFPLAYSANGEYWGFDVEFAIAVAEKLGWHIKMQPIEKENVSFHDYTYSIFKTFLAHKRGILIIHQAQLSYLLLDALNACFHVNTTNTKSILEQFQTAWHVGGIYNGMLLWFEHGMKESAQLMTDITLSFRPAGSLSLRDMKKA